MKMKTMIVNMVIFVALLLTIETVGGVPANPTPFTLTQPDNSSFQAIQVGDERGAHFETLDGYTMVKDENNWWNYAKKDEKGKLASTDQRVGLTEPERISLQKHLHPGVDAVELRPVEGQATINPVSALPRILPSALAPQVCTKKALVILINFIDVSQNVSRTPSYYENLLFNASAGANSMNNYYKEVSYNKMNITGVVAGNRWFSASHNLAWYGADVTGTDEDTTQPDANNWYIFKLAKEAVIAADPYVDYSQYDTNGDGVIDNLIIVHAGNAQESSGVSTDIWSHRGSIYVWNGSWNLGYMTNDGVKAVGYTMQAETSPLGTFAHEFGHDIGLPDLYDTDYSSVGVGYWDIMGSGGWLNNGNTPAHLSAWSKYFLGWVNPTKVTASFLNEQINQSETYDDVYMFLDNPGDSPGNLNWRSNGTGTGEYFLVENRRKTGYDAYLPGEGLLIWHIDESRGNNTNESRKLVDLEEADGLNHLDSNANSGDAFDPWYNSIAGFTESTTPNSNLYNGGASGVRVTNISASASIMTANLISGSNNGTISSCTTISSPGTYVLNQNIINSSASTCIAITSSNVIFDGAGYTIDGVDTYSYGVYVFNDASTLTNITVKNLVATNWYYAILYKNIVDGHIINNTANSNEVGIFLWSSNNSMLSGNSANLNNFTGIYAWESSNYNTLTGNIANSNIWHGIAVQSNSNNNILSNNIALNNKAGIELYLSRYNTLSNNNASYNKKGIFLDPFSENNTLSNNIASNNNEEGIGLENSSNNILNFNVLSNNKQGIKLVDNSTYNTLSYNTINLNNEHGIRLKNSSNNSVYNNYFNNTNNFGISNSVNNWNTTKTSGTNIVNGSYIGGNVWANPDGTGFSQTCSDADSDGICDSSYTLASGNIDYLPLKSNLVPIPGDVTGNGVVDAIDSMFLAQYVAGTRLTLPQQQAGDVASPCGSIDAIDSMFVAQYVAGTRPSLQLCS